MSYRNTENIQNKYNYYTAINNNTYSENINPLAKISNSSLNYSKQNFIDKLPLKQLQNFNPFHTDNNNINYNDYEEEEKNNFIKNDDYNEYDDENYEYNKKDYGEQYDLSNKVMKNFRKIMEKTKIIQNKILLKSKDLENNIFNNSYFCKDNTSKILNYTNKKNNNWDNYEEDINDYLIIDSNNNYINKTKNHYNKNNEISPQENMQEKLKKKNQTLSDMNSKIILKNNLLESEIANYESKQINPQNNNINYNTFYFSLKKFLKNLKISLKKNVESNKSIGEKIIGELIENQKMNENNIKNRDVYEKLRIKYQKENERISDIQKYNLENNKRYLYLKDEKNFLNKTYEKLLMNLSNLKSNEKNLILKRDSIKKNKNNNQELIQALNKNIHKLNRENSDNAFLNTNKNNKLIQKQNSVNLYNDKINQLIDIYKNLQNEKNLINEENMKMKNELGKNQGEKLVTENNKLVKENELKIEINDIKLNNYNIEKQIQEKDELIKKMKNLIKQFTSNVNNDENKNKDIKNQIAELMYTESIVLNTRFNNSKLNENKLDKEINKQINLNIKLENQIKSVIQNYDDLINKKDKEILNLENAISSVDNKNIINEEEYHNIVTDRKNKHNDYNQKKFEEEEGNEYDNEEYNFQNYEDEEEKEENLEDIKNKNFEEEEVEVDN